MLLTVSDATYEDYGSVVLLRGTDENGRVWRFGVDLRPAMDIMNAVDVEGEITVEVEGWQLWGRGE